MPYRGVVDISWTGASGSPGVNVWHARASGSPLRDALDVLTGNMLAFYTAVLGLYPNGTSLKFNGEWQGVGPDTGALEISDDWALTGDGGSGFAPPANCVLVSWRAGSGGRSGRGRTFLGPIASAQVEGNGTPGETGRAVVQGAANDLISSQDGEGDGALGIWSRTDSLFRDFVTADVPNYFAVLRSRRD